ncbi:MAG: BatD family protein [Muribaculaceae bacterium]|nr:BatD family protein [Muribaculaceae bacterium]
MSKKLLLFSLVLIIASACLEAASVSISVSPQSGKSKIEVNDLFYLTLNVSDATVEPQAPQLKGARLVYFDMMSGSAQSYTVNGVTRGSYSGRWVATYRALAPGSYSAGPVSIGDAKSNQVKYSVVGAGASGSSSADAQDASAAKSNAGPDSQDDNGKPRYIGKGDSNLFLRASVSSSSAYEQQALVYTLKIYTTYDGLNFLGATASPKFDGFVVEQSSDISTSWSFEVLDGKTYKSAVVARYIIFPQMTGSLRVVGNTYTVSVSQREYYHDSFWGNLSYSKPLQLNVTPNDLVINVNPLPEPKPADFSGGVGQFSISSSLSSQEFKSNQAGSIVYTVKGSGNVKYVQLPDLDALFPPEIEVSTPKTTQDIKIGSSNTSGSITFDYSIMPLDEGNFRIPVVKLVYFNPEAGKYETAVAKGYDINVGKGSGPAAKISRAPKFDSKLMDVSSDGLALSHKPWVYGSYFWLFFIIPVAFLIIVIIAFRRYKSIHADMASFKSGRADKIARKRLRKAANAMKKNDKEIFYHELLLALWGYISDKLKMPTSELMRDNIRQVLSQKNISSESIDRFIEAIDEAEFAKYSSAAGSQSLSQAYDGAVRIINDMEKEFK